MDATNIFIMYLSLETHVNTIVAVILWLYSIEMGNILLPGSDGYNSSTIFITNNLKQCVFWGFTEYIHSGNGAAREKGVCSGITLILFFTGASLGYVYLGLAGIKKGV